MPPHRSVWMVTAMARTRRSAVTSKDEPTSLTTKERALVQTILDAAAEGTKFPTRQQLGSLAGYGTGDTARTQCCRALTRPHVRLAIREGLEQIAGVDVARSYQTLRLAAERAPSHRDRIAAAGRILDLAGMGRPDGSMGSGVAIQIVFKSAEAVALLHAPPVPRQAMQRPALSHMAED